MIQTFFEPNHRFFHQILSLLPVPVIIIDVKGKILYFNLMAEQITGYSQEEIIGKPCSNLCFKDCQMPCSILASTGSHSPRLGQSQFCHKNGKKLSAWRGIYSLKNEHGKIIGALETLIDINWRSNSSLCLPECLKVAGIEISFERHLRKIIEQSKNKLLGIFDEIIDGLFMIDHEYRIKAINKTQAFYLKKTPKELIENFCYMVIANRNSPCPVCKSPQVFTEGITKTDLNIKFDEDNRCIYSSKDHRRYVNIHYIPIRTDIGQVHNVLIYIQDISKIKELEEGVRRAENLASLGILASGMAHEINNPLQVILSGANCLIKKVEDREIVLEVASQIKECAEKMANIIKELSLYARGIREEKDMALININQSIEDSISMASHVRNMKKISIEKNLQKVDLILGNAGHFQQIFVNLIINAVDAVKEEGKISFKTSQEDGFVYMRIEDTGVGIKEEDLPHIFDPFFTTKEPGKGTGLGLHVVYRLVNQYQGKIRVDTQKNQGTTFILKFPTAAANKVESCTYET